MKHYLLKFTEYHGEDEVDRNYAYVTNNSQDNLLKCKTDRQYIKWFYNSKPIADDLTERKELWWLGDKYVRFNGCKKISKATYKILEDLGVA